MSTQPRQEKPGQPTRAERDKAARLLASLRRTEVPDAGGAPQRRRAVRVQVRRTR
jgi:hypothetical protein